MAIEGPLRELGIHDVFQLLDLSRKTGTLRVTSELRHNEGKIYFDNGVVVSAEIRSNPHPLGALLLRTGKIAEADLERVGIAADLRRHDDAVVEIDLPLVVAQLRGDPQRPRLPAQVEQLEDVVDPELA